MENEKEKNSRIAIAVDGTDALLILQLNFKANEQERKVAREYAEQIRNTAPKLSLNILNWLNTHYPEVPANQLLLFQGEALKEDTSGSDTLFPKESFPEVQMAVLETGKVADTPFIPNSSMGVATWDIFIREEYICSAKGGGFLEACLNALYQGKALPLDLDAFGRTILINGYPTISGNLLSPIKND